MREVRIKKSELLAKLEENRAEHRSTFLEALDGYKVEVIKILTARLKDAKTGKRIPQHITIQQPVDQTREYDRVIAMLKMSVDDEVTLQAQEFQQYVMDQWVWKHQFLASNSAYSVKAATTLMTMTGEDE